MQLPHTNACYSVAMYCRSPDENQLMLHWQLAILYILPANRCDLYTSVLLQCQSKCLNWFSIINIIVRTFLFAQKGTQKRPPGLITPQSREGSLIKLLCYCSAKHQILDSFQRFKTTND